jgi:PelA/Pel-15E family pectate lyase
MKQTLPAAILALLLAISLIGCQQQTPAPKPDAGKGAIAWQDYKARSDHWRSIDQDFMRAEQIALGLDKPLLPEATSRFGFDTNQPVEWYAMEEGRRVADIIVSFQTPSGGWSKRTHMAHRERQPGEAFGVELKYIPTFDNHATTVQLRVLARAYQATGEQAYLSAFLQGINLLLEAQYPNGGWPQNFPLVGGYHDYITYNDEVMENNLSLLYYTSLGRGEFAFVPEEVRIAAGESLARGLQVVLDTQATVDGKRTLWGGQHDPHTLQPVQARAYEMASLATAESVSLLDFLMNIEQPSAEIIQAIHAAADWYEANKIVGHTWEPGDAAITPAPDAAPMWARFVEIGTNRPLFGDRDGSIHYDIGAISEERRSGYRWYVDSPNRVLKKYVRWSKNFPR